MGERHLIIDFDGVVNARRRTLMARQWGTCHTLTMRGFRINFVPEMIGRIEQWARDGVQVTWLTTWADHVALFESMGMSMYRSIGSAEFASSTEEDLIWWKWVALEKFVATLPEDARIVWCDDRMDKESRGFLDITKFRLQPNVLSFCPSIEEGLTRAQIERIGAFLT